MKHCSFAFVILNPCKQFLCEKKYSNTKISKKIYHTVNYFHYWNISQDKYLIVASQDKYLIIAL